ncbi:MAG: hypothetical protein ACKVJE_14100 [Pseudomonadales bacterium]
MQYQLSIRKITELDINVNRPFLPEDEDYEMYLSAFIEDIENLDYVTELNQNGSCLLITIGSEAEFELLHSAVKKLLNKQFYDKLDVGSGLRKIE